MFHILLCYACCTEDKHKQNVERLSEEQKAEVLAAVPWIRRLQMQRIAMARYYIGMHIGMTTQECYYIAMLVFV